jgi:hypothetical protein
MLKRFGYFNALVTASQIAVRQSFFYYHAGVTTCGAKAITIGGGIIP